VKCDSCKNKVDLLIPVVVLDEFFGRLIEKKKRYCARCFYTRTDPVKTLTDHPLKEASRKILEKEAEI